ncbi:glutamate--cysteine ligase [Halioglobus japonicus]|uniref:glutamate--cysteine ligase n=1 Tax=Halioglobus japonicus TaxID=930805 RepID=UPI0009797EEB|nr:glutamate--cysteine ligase [Halioglobus japonicus]AQA17944.1 glutamate--cysteine ligase [Halioglobus japonicus]GHD18136.1 glutamate--cysteine ligase [Halioglobus japonicus]
MSSFLQAQVTQLAQPERKQLLGQIGRGIEKESLRVSTSGKLSQQPHPQALGSALTHGSITTDYSEALLEFITPVSADIDQSLAQLSDIHAFTYRNIDEELLWSTSMPCVVGGDDSIPVARYGSSNVAQMKTAYRYGLGHRYGRAMQTIAGIHYNFSMPHRYWELEWEATGSPGKLKHFITERYLDLIRNFRRHAWLLVYLYGASPALCPSFLQGREHTLEKSDDGNSLYLPYATSLRMGDLGYTSNAQSGLSICYNSLDNYVETLRTAITTPHAEYADIAHGENGDYQQLNDSLLQIENEFYSPIRPKRVANSGETPLSALRRGGIQYIEVRCVDVSPFAPLGLDAEQIRFMDIFLLHCLLAPSDACNENVQRIQTANLTAVVNRGRDPELMLECDDGPRALSDWAQALLEEMQPIAALLDDVHETVDYSESMATQQAKVEDPELTPSARVLREMREKNLPFFRLAMAYSQHWAQYFRELELDEDAVARLQQEADASLVRQAEIEATDDISFEQYLRNFYAQYQLL